MGSKEGRLSRRRIDLVIALSTLLVGLVLSIIVGVITSNPSATVLTGFLTVFLGILVDLRIANNELVERVNPPMVSSYEQFKNDGCPLFQKVAIEKYEELEVFFVIFKRIALRRVVPHV
jgi:hypothetical protein